MALELQSLNAGQFHATEGKNVKIHTFVSTDSTFGVTTSLALDNASAGRMLMSERWQDQEALNAHFRGPQVASFGRWVGRITNDVKQYDASNERPLVD